MKIKILVITDTANGDYNVEETDLLTGHGVCSCAEIDNGATVEAGKDKVEARTPDKEWSGEQKPRKATWPDPESVQDER